MSLSFGKTPISTFETYSRPISMMMRMLDKTMTKILVHKSCQLRHHSCFISRAERLPPSYIFLDESKPTNLQWPKTHQLWSLVLFTNSLLLVIINDTRFKLNVYIMTLVHNIQENYFNFAWRKITFLKLPLWKIRSRTK